MNQILQVGGVFNERTRTATVEEETKKDDDAISSSTDDNEPITSGPLQTPAEQEKERRRLKRLKAKPD